MSKEICAFFLKNACNKGDRCFYRHDRASTKTIPMQVTCLYFKLGSCKFGDQCLNRHEGGDFKNDLDEFNTRTPCKYFVLGNCRRGGDCLYDHGIKGPLSPSLSTSPSGPVILDLNSTSRSSHTFVEHSNPSQQSIPPSIDGDRDKVPLDGQVVVSLESKPLPPSETPLPKPASLFDDRRDDGSQTSERTSVEQLNDANGSEINFPSPGLLSPLPHLAYTDSSSTLSTGPYHGSTYYQQGLYSYPGYRLPVHCSLPVSPTILSPLPPLQLQPFQPVVSSKNKDTTVPLCQQHFEKNACLYTSEACHFRHILSADEYKALSKPLPSMQTHTPNTSEFKKGKCLFYGAGKCKNGDACSYLHENSEQTVVPRTAGSPFNENNDLRDDSRKSTTTNESPKATSGGKLCHYYLQGKCREGDACTYSHEKEPPSEQNPSEVQVPTYNWGYSSDDCNGWDTGSGRTPWDNVDNNESHKSYSPRSSSSRVPRSKTPRSHSGTGSRSSPLPSRPSRCQTPERIHQGAHDRPASLETDTGISASDSQPEISHFAVPQISDWDKSESNEDDKQTPAPTQAQLDDAATWDQDWGDLNTSQPQSDQVDSRKVDLPCKFFGQGHCTWGDDCRFQHIRQEEHEHVEVLEEQPERESEFESIETPPDTQPNHATSAEQSIFQCCVQFGPGGIPEEVSTSFESHTVVISNVPPAISSQHMDELDRLVASFGIIYDQMTETIDDAVQVKVDYSSVPEAALAARSLNNYQFHSAILTAHLNSSSPIEYNSRPAKGSCWVKIAYPTPSRRAWCFYRTITQAKQEVKRLDGRIFGGRKVKVSFQDRLASRRNQNASAICLENLPLQTEKDDLKRFCNDPMLVEITSPNYDNLPLEDIRRLLHSFGDIQLFEHIPSPPFKSKALAFARFHDADAAVLAVQNLNDTKHDFIGANVLTVQLTYYYCTDISSRQMAIIKSEIERIRDSRFEECKIQWDSEGDTTRIRVFSPKAQVLARTMKELRVLLYGEVMLIPEDTQPFWDQYFDTSSCQKVLGNLNHDISSFILLDFRNRHVLLFGSGEARSRAKEKVLSLVKRVAKMRYSLSDLSGPGIRTLLDGGMEALENRGINSNQMVLDVVSREFSLWGDVDDFQKVVQVVDQCESDPSAVETSVSCVICRLPPVEPKELSCQHIYCNRCILHYIRSRITPPFEKLLCLARVQDDDELPHYPCTTEIPLFLIEDLLSPEETLGLLETSFLAHVQSLPAEFRMCPSIDCRSVYRVTEEDTVIRCSECKLFICSHCNVISHDGLTCSEYQQIDTSHT